MTLLDVILLSLALGLFGLWLSAEARRQVSERQRTTYEAAIVQAKAALAEASTALSAGESERRAAVARAEAAEVARAEAAEAKLAERVDRRKRLALLTDDEVREQLASRCNWCGGVHSKACPRVRSLRFRPDGVTPTAVEFWETWDASDVIWPEDYVAAQADALAADRQPKAEPELRVITG
jgi:multidrug efflux pump subunit AcrA (membrane-fusion protein)